MNKVLREALDFYRQRRKEEADKDRLLNAKADFHLLEQLIQKCNDNPRLAVSVFLRDGTRLELRTRADRQKRDFEMIDGDYLEIR